MKWRWPWQPRPEEVAQREAVHRAQRRLEQVKRKDVEVDRLADGLRALSEGNGFAELLASAFRDHRR